MSSSMNNWLGFSLSPQELQDHHHHHHHPQTNFNSDEISTAQISNESCFDLPSDSGIPSLNLPAPPFNILEAFNRNPHSHQEWNMNDVSLNTFSHNMEDESRPKLENFLGAHQEQQKSSNYQLNGNENSYNMYQENEATSNNSSTIGLSMITNWLRNNPAPPQQDQTKEVAPPSSASATAAAQTLSLSMSTGSQSSSPLPSDTKLAAVVETQTQTDQTETAAVVESVPRKSIDTFGQRTSIYRGVTRHRWTGRYEAHLWDNSCRREGQTRKGRQVYLGGYDKEDKAARAYDLAALKYWGTTTTTNFPMSNYEKEIEDMKHMTRQEYVASLRRKSSGFSRGASMYRGVTRHHQHGRWQARIGRVAGNKDLYLGTFSTEEEAAEAYDIAAIKFRGLNAVTNFEINRYDVKSILESSTLPIGGAAKRLKDAEKAEMALNLQRANESSLSMHNQMTAYATTNTPTTHPSWPTIAFQPSQPLSMYPYAHQRLWCKQEHDINDGFNDLHHQLQLGNTHNFLQQQPSVLHNLMSLDSSNMEHSSGSNNVVYGNGSTGNGSTAMMGTVIVQDGNQNHNLDNYEAMFGSADAYQQARNFYYQTSSNLAKAAENHVYDHGSNATNWIPTAVPAISPRGSNMHGASTFTVWNDT